MNSLLWVELATDAVMRYDHSHKHVTEGLKQVTSDVLNVSEKYKYISYAAIVDTTQFPSI